MFIMLRLRLALRHSFQAIFSDQVAQDKRFTPSQYYQLEQFPLLVVNCTYFSFETNQNLSMVMKDGKLVAYSVISLQGRGEDSNP